jgi:hypothetical protein
VSVRGSGGRGAGVIRPPTVDPPSRHAARGLRRLTATDRGRAQRAAGRDQHRARGQPGAACAVVSVLTSERPGDGLFGGILIEPWLRVGVVAPPAIPSSAGPGRS